MADSGCPSPVRLRGALFPARPRRPRHEQRVRQAVQPGGPRRGGGKRDRFLVFSLGLLLLLPGAGSGLRAAEQKEADSLRAAVEDFRLGSWKQAEADFDEFARKYPESTNLPYAFLFQAVARFHQTNYVGTIDLLSSHQSQAGKEADAYVFWQAKALQAKGDNAAAAGAFGKLIQQFPGSPLCLEAAVEEARARATLREWARVVELLEKRDGVFQSAARTNASGEAVASGWLLLGEAQLARRDYGGVEAAVQPLARLAQEGKRLSPGAAWQWQYLVARLRVAQGREEEALANSTNLLAAAAAARDPGQQADTYAFVAELFERLGRPEEAINAYTNNLATGVPTEPQYQAVRRVTELLVNSNKLAQAASRLEDFAARVPDAPATSLALLLLGELRLRQQVSGPVPGPAVPAPAATNAPAVTNYLEKAIAALTQLTLLTNKSAQSRYPGRAELDLGWCYWLQGKWLECQTNCQLAVERLTNSMDQATARFKLGDALFEQRNYAGAITQYNAIIDHYADVPQVRSNLFESALYQAARAGLAGGDRYFGDATNALAKIVQLYPGGFHTDRAVLMVGQEKSRRGNPADARRLFEEAVRRAPDSALSAQLAFAIARTYERENNLAGAIAEYSGWIGRFPTNAARPQAEYYLAINQFLAGDVTNALARMTNFVARYTNDAFTPLAQWWLGDYYYRYDNQYLKAELIYQEIYKNTNQPPSDLTYQAQLMAGRSAMRRQGWPEAINHFTNLTSLGASCPRPIWVQAMFAYGDALVSQASTNKAQDYADASRVFNEIRIAQPTNRLAAAALGAKANCYWQLGQQKGQSDQLTNAAQAYQEAMAFTNADVRVRSMAEVGWGMVIEKQASLKTDPERTAMLEQALGHYGRVFGANNLVGDEQPDPFWVEKAGLEAARIEEELGRWSTAVDVYQRLADLFPPLRPWIEKNKLPRAREKAGTR